MSRGEDLNLQPEHYKCPALPLSYPGIIKILSDFHKKLKSREGTDIITVLQDKVYMSMIREKLNVIKKVQKQYGYVPA